MQPCKNNSVYFDLEKFTIEHLGDVRRLVDLSFFRMRTIPHVYDFSLFTNVNACGKWYIAQL